MVKELLAPAGDLEAGYAALYYGADAVYLGLQKFSARATAVNFNEENLNEFVGYAHSLSPRRKVFVAINTLVQNAEISDLIESLNICSRCHVDAIIIQDLGVAKIVRDFYPELEMHASTQMAVHNKNGALALQKFGFKRVVAARELSQKEIAEITSIPNLEVEAFIHGALCYSYSGICLFSSMETGRSANRGKCLYPCRACFKCEDGDKHYFSMKDMALEQDVLKMPAYSLKIEGRKKSALYVAAVTDFYRRLLDGKGEDYNRAENIKQIFSRPWCKFHFNGRDKNVIDRDFVGHRGLSIGQISKISKNSFTFVTNHDIARHDGIQIDVQGEEKPFGFSLLKMKVNSKFDFEAHNGDLVEVFLPPHAPQLKVGDNVYLASSSLVKGAYPYTKPKPNEYLQRQAIDVVVEIFADKISANAGDYSAEVSGVFEPARDALKTEQAVVNAFSKTGDTVFSLKNILVKNPEKLFAPVSILNELRRKLYALIPQVKNKTVVLPELSVRKFQSAKWVIKTDDISCLQNINLNDVDEIVYLLDEKAKLEDVLSLPKAKVRLSLPTINRSEKFWSLLIQKFLDDGFKKWEVSNYWGISALPDKGIDLSFSREIYMLNSYAIAAAKEMGAGRVNLSVEDTYANLQSLVASSSLPVVLNIYEDVALFTSAVCIRSNPCEKCPKGEKWIDLSYNGKKYQALSRNCQTFMFDKEPFVFNDDYFSLKADFYQVCFVYKKYTPQQARDIFYKLKNGQSVVSSQHGNLDNQAKF